MTKVISIKKARDKKAAQKKEQSKKNKQTRELIKDKTTGKVKTLDIDRLKDEVSDDLNKNNPVGESLYLNDVESKALREIKNKKFLAENELNNEKLLILLESAELSRHDCQWIIQDYLGLTLFEFCEKYEMRLTYLKDVFTRKRPLSPELVDAIKQAAVRKLRGNKITISFED